MVHAPFYTYTYAHVNSLNLTSNWARGDNSHLEYMYMYDNREIDTKAKHTVNL